MPIPTRRANEDTQDFISRCMDDPTMKQEYPDNNQRLAVCHSQVNANSDSKMSIHKDSAYILNNYELRTEYYMGREHIVAPVVLMVEGVHNGSQGPTLYTAEELSKFPDAWNGRPIPVYHPEDEYGPIPCNDPNVLQQQSVGHLFNVHFTDNKLKGEIWVDKERANNISPSVLSMLQNKEPIEVSTGVFTDPDPIQGQWQGETYMAIAHNLRPDHLALLPGERGACSWEDGCGVRANKEEGGANVPMKRTKQPGSVQTLSGGNQSVQKVHPLIQINQDYLSLANQIRSKLDGMDNDIKMYFLEELHDEFFIYSVRYNETGEREFYQRDYTVNDDEVEFGDVLQVEKQVEYVPVNLSENSKNGKDGENNEEKNGGVETMSEKKNEAVTKKVDELVANESTSFTEEDKAWLSNLTECQLKKLEPVVQETGNLEVNKEQAIQVLKDSLQSEDQFLNLLPDEMKDQFQHGLKLHKERRESMIKNITSNSDVYAEEELRNKNTDELEKLSKLVKPVGNYAGIGGSTVPTANSDVEPLTPTGVEIQADK